MADFEINNPVTFTKNVRKFETKDKGHADIFNHVTAALVNNDAYLEESKVDKVEGKGLSTNDYTNADKNKLSGIAEGAEVNVQADWNVSDSNSDTYIKNKPQAMKNPTSLNISLNGISQGAYDGSSQKNVNITAENIGADSSGTAETKVSEHNGSEEAHADIRNLITTLTTRLNVLADSDDTTLDQLSEIVAYIKNNKSLIDGITTSKVNVSDIIDNLTSSVTNKPLAAKQGKVLKDLIDTLTSTVEGKVNKAGDTMTGTLYTKNLLVSTSSANGGTDGYINFARIKITGPYADRVVAFKIGGRYRRVTNIFVRFSGNNANPSISSYWKNGDCSYGIYIFKSNEDTPTWDLCAQKYTSWGEVTVLTSHYTGTIEVTYPGAFVAQKGDNWIEAEIETIGNAFNSDTVDGKHASDFVSKSGDTMTGDLVVPIQRANANMSVPCAGRIDSTTLIPQGLSECKTFLGSIVDENSTFWNIISTRHGNGYNDGRYFGMYIRSLLLGEGSHGGSLLWNKQMGSNKGWLGERVLLDSVNYKDFCLSLSGGVMTGEILVTYGRMTKFNSDYGGIIAGGSIVSDNLTDLSNYRSFVGTHLNGNNKWNHVISARHHNGYGDGNLYGMYLRTPITTNEDDMNLYWRFQNSNWADERVLLDSQNYEKYCLPLSNESLIAENSVCRISLLSKVGNTERCGIEAYTKGNGRTGGLYFYNGNATLKSYNTFSIDVTEDVDTARAYYFDTDGLYAIIDHVDLGKSSFHWRNIYANNGTIQTSDRTKKTNINSLEAQKVQAFINGLNPVSYKMLDGTSGRTHYGFIAQDIEELMNTLNMDSSDFAGFIKSPKKNIRYEDENGNKLKKPVEEVIENEYDYALRYDEFIAPLIKVVQEQQKTIEQQQRMIEQQQIAIENQQKEIEQIKKDISRIYSPM